ncbi:hypothetical protein [Streptomyces prasinopilosus]|uniref:hypothetical protein n=1 Tax=Streptomyces prasinopilosus TaxID=67344 RepID=UPI000AB033E3|nr:hypothetical protein [Streptomyces prasinopilosus]
MEKPFVASEPHECKKRAEDPQLPTEERLVWAQLAVAAELFALRKDRRRAGR